EDGCREEPHGWTVAPGPISHDARFRSCRSAAAKRADAPVALGHELRADLAGGLDEAERGRGPVAVAMPEHADQPRLHRDVGRELDDRGARVALVEREARDDRAAHAGADEGLHGRDDVRAEDEVRLDALSTQLGLDPREHAAGPVADQRLAGNLLEA